MGKSTRAQICALALYILLGEDENGSAQAYIGESTNGVKRIYNHKSHKLFWNKCLMFVAKDESINKADVQYLERKAKKLVSIYTNNCYGIERKIEVLEPKSVRDEMKKDYYTKKECVFGRHILFRIMESKWIISY